MNINEILPLLMKMNNGQNLEELFTMLGKNNPNLNGLLNILPNLQNSQIKKDKQSTKFDSYVKINDFYKQ